MNVQKTRLAVLLSAVVLSFSIPAVAGPGHGRGPGPGGWERSQLTQEQRQQYRQYHEEKIQARLNLTAKQLNITSAQQSAWDSYSRAVKQAMMRFDQAPPARDADAATVAKFRADRAAEHAKALAQLSDATTKLQATLTTEQRSIFNDMVCPQWDGSGPRGHGFGPGGGRGWRGGPGGPGHHRGPY